MDAYRYEISIYKGNNLVNTLQLFNDGEEQGIFTRFVKDNYGGAKLFQNLLNLMFP